MPVSRPTTERLYKVLSRYLSNPAMDAFIDEMQEVPGTAPFRGMAAKLKVYHEAKKAEVRSAA